VAKRNGIIKTQGSEIFTVYTVAYKKLVTLADSIRAMKQAVIECDIMPVLGNKVMSEITTSVVRDLCDRLVERGGRRRRFRAGR